MARAVAVVLWTVKAITSPRHPKVTKRREESLGTAGPRLPQDVK